MVYSKKKVGFLPCLNGLKLNILSSPQEDFSLAIIKTVIFIYRVY